MAQPTSWCYHSAHTCLIWCICNNNANDTIFFHRLSHNKQGCRRVSRSTMLPISQIGIPLLRPDIFNGLRAPSGVVLINFILVNQWNDIFKAQNGGSATLSGQRSCASAFNISCNCCKSSSQRGQCYECCFIFHFLRHLYSFDYIIHRSKRIRYPYLILSRRWPKPYHGIS